MSFFFRFFASLLPLLCTRCSLLLFFVSSSSSLKTGKTREIEREREEEAREEASSALLSLSLRGREEKETLSFFLFFSHPSSFPLFLPLSPTPPPPPPPDHQSQVGYVQSRWTFANPDESYLTKAQEISLNFHVKCEQFVHFAEGSFFNFNGTAGVWRRKTIVTVGGWQSRTTVEDMDLSLRTYVNGWKAVYLTEVTCVNELPAQFFAYRKQQHRWTCGPIQLWLKASKDIWASSLPLSSKLNLILCYFGVRKFATHWVSLGFFCTLVPLSVFEPEVNIPLWALVHLPVVVTVTTAIFTPKGWLHCILYVLFENAMGIVKLGAVVAGMLDLKHANEWVVTTKLGSSDKRPGTQAAAPARQCRVYPQEAAMAAFVLVAALYAMVSADKWSFAVFLTLQGLVFLAFGFNLIDAGNFLGQRLGANSPPTSAAKKAAAKAGAPLAKRTFTM